MDEFNKIASAKNLALHTCRMAEIQTVTSPRNLFGDLIDDMFKDFR